MAPALPALTLLVVHAVSFSPQTVNATGHQEVLLTLDAPAAIHLSARSASGTACEVFDKVRGPFARAGTAGSVNCELDLLLDAGAYKVHLESAKRGKGQVTVSATAFTELNATPVRLAPLSSVVTTLKPRQQASYWLSVGSRGVPWVRVAGRHAGDVRLWRNGAWLEPTALQHTQFSPTPGQPQHEWWVDALLEEGEYQLVIYGRDPTTVAGSSTDDSLTVEYGFREMPPERSLPFVLGPSGVLAVQVPQGGIAAIGSLEASPKAPVALQIYRGGVRNLQSECHIDKGALIPECSALSPGSSGKDSSAVLLVRGPAGTRGQLEWAPLATERATAKTRSWGDYFSASSASLPFSVGRPGQYLVAATELPNDLDAAPLGCQLEELAANGSTARVVARSALRLNAGERLQRDFNFPEDGALVWFELGSGGSMLQRSGLTSRRFKVAVSGKGACEVSRFSPSNGAGGLQRLTQSKPEGACDELLALEPGFYQLQLAPALAGVRTLTIEESGASGATPATATGNCQLGVQTLNAAAYRLVMTRTGAGQVRAVTVEAVPVSGTVHLPLDSRQSLTFPVEPASTLLVRAAAGAAFTCSSQSGKAVSRGSACELPAGADTLTLTNPGPAPLSLTLVQPGALAEGQAPQAWKPVIKPIASIGLDTPTWFDFEVGQAHSVTFDVEAAGLYNLTTLGLLSTRCVLRTPAVEKVAENEGAGRGRNCLIQTWLQKGRYLLTASTTGRSAGRAALSLSRRNAKELPGVSGEGEQFFRVDANDLIQQKLAVRSEGRYQLGTTAQGVSGLSCRLDDPEGWPLEAVPTTCTGERALRAGTWLWTQLPLTVESMRHTSLTRVKEEVVLKGNKPHPLEFFTWYSAQLGADGKDEFRFKLEGDTQLDVVLSNGMQGRVYLLEKDKAPRPVEVIPPQAVAPEQGASDTGSEADQSQPDEQRAAPPDSENGEGPEPAEGAEDQQATAPVQTVRAEAAPPPPSGVKVSLPAGQYSLVTEHSRADVGVEYRLHLGSATLLPGMTREVPTPSTVPVLIPRDGTLRLRTSGDADVRCRLLDASGKLVFEGSDNGADWNCALAEPIVKGRYTLVLESETQQRGTTRLSLALPAVDELGPLTDGALATLAGSVVTWSVPVAEKDSVQELSVKAQNKTPISCALEDPAGVVAVRRARVSECTLLLRPRLEKWKLRAWTTDGSAPVQVAFKSRPIVEGRSEAPADKAVALSIARAGRYHTGAQIFCIGAQQTGVLRPCGPEVSLEAGVSVFSTTGLKAQPLALDEVLAAASDTAAKVSLTRLPSLQTISANPFDKLRVTGALFLLEATVQHGERAAPACGFDGPGTVRERRDDACFAASRVGATATARLWAPTDSELEAQVTRRAAVLPETFDTLSPGHRQLTFANGLGRFGLPRGSRTRLELVIPGNAWAVLLDDGGAALDVCAPSAQLRRCLLTGQGGSVAIVARAGVADVTTITLEGVAPAVGFSGLYEDSPRTPGSVRLAVQSAEAERLVSIEGALRCTVALSDGTRLASCRGRLPAGSGAELLIEYGGGPLRALVYPPGRERWARLGVELPIVPGAALAPAVAVPVQGARVDRSLVVEQESVVRISAEAGVCGLFRGNELLSVDGLESGCEVVRVLSPGTYRLLLRPFGGQPLPQGLLRWTSDPVSQLAEGVGAPTWLAPGDVRLYRFETANAGKIGLGVQATSELLECAVYKDTYQLVGEGCHQYLPLEKGHYLLTIRNPAAAGAVPRSFKPVLLGLKGETHEIPEDYLNDLFRRAEVRP